MACHRTATTPGDARRPPHSGWTTEYDRRLRAEALSRGAHASRACVPRWFAELDATSPRSAERDALVADWLRAYRRDGDALALTAALCAIIPLLEVLFARAVRGRRGRRDESELREALWYAAIERLCVFDPDTRSPCVHHGIELDIWNHLCAMWRRESRARAVLGWTAAVVLTSRDLLACGEVNLSDFLERPAPDDVATRARFDSDEVEHAREYLDALGAAGVVSTRDAALLLGVRVRQCPLRDVAAALGISEAAARKAVQRAAAAVRVHLARTRRE